MEERLRLFVPSEKTRREKIFFRLFLFNQNENKPLQAAELEHLQQQEIPKLHNGLNALGLENASLLERAEKAESRTEKVQKERDTVKFQKEELEAR